MKRKNTAVWVIMSHWHLTRLMTWILVFSKILTGLTYLENLTMFRLREEFPPLRLFVRRLVYCAHKPGKQYWQPGKHWREDTHWVCILLAFCNFISPFLNTTLCFYGFFFKSVNYRISKVLLPCTLYMYTRRAKACVVF